MTEVGLTMLQRWMQAVLVDPLGEAEQPPHAHLPAELHAGTVEAIVRPSRRLTPHQHLAIYQRSYLARLRECMAGQFPVLRHALGDDLFEHFADLYLQRHPSRSYSLASLGQGFAAFLEETRPDRDAGEREWWPDFLVEMAGLEDAIAELFDAEEPQPPDAAAPASLVAPTVRLIAANFPIVAYYRAVQRGDEPDLPLPERSHALLVRNDLRLGLFDLQPAQYHLLACLQEGGALGEAVAVAAGASGVPATAIAEMWPRWRRRWVEEGALLGAA